MLESFTRGVGTPFYQAPEVETGHYDHRADNFSVGMILLEMLIGRHPRRDEEGADIQ